MTSDYLQEIKRKAIHLSSLWIPLLYAFVSTDLMVKIIGIAAVLVVSLDVGRHYSPDLARLTHLLFGKILRNHEKNGSRTLSGASFLLLAAFVVIGLFSKAIACSALMVVVISDTCAALIGKQYGITPLLDKTREGTLAFIISGWLATGLTLALFDASFVLYLSGFFAVIVGAIAELYSKQLRIDDNFSITISVALSMWLFSFIL